jgi:hypothetical protein
MACPTPRFQGCERLEYPQKASDICRLARVDDVEVERTHRGAIAHRGQASNNQKIDIRLTQRQ